MFQNGQPVMKLYNNSFKQVRHVVKIIVAVNKQAWLYSKRGSLMAGTPTH